MSGRLGGGRGGGGWEVRAVRGALLEPAAHRLSEHAAPGDGDAGRRFLAAARSQNVDIGCFFAAVGPAGEVMESALAVPGAGRTAMFFTSHPESEAGEPALASAIGAACDTLEGGDSGAALAQALLLPGEVRSGRSFEMSGFEELARLGYLRWRLRGGGLRTVGGAGAMGVGGRAWSLDALWSACLGESSFEVEGLTMRRVSSLATAERDVALARALGRSYEETMDCPALCRMREPEDVLASHRAVGAYDPSLWWLLSVGDREVGAVLWSAMRRVGGAPVSAELVYMGIGPEVRGRGLGRRLLAFTAEEVVRRGARELTCAVDLANTPACAMYERCGFRPYAERRALVRAVGGGGGVTSGDGGARGV